MDNQPQQWQQQQQQQLPFPQQQSSQYGCTHYSRNCMIQAPCCKIFYSCRLCHDEKYEGVKSKNCQVERMAFADVEQVKCCKCGEVQEPREECRKCGIVFGKYTCLKCKLYENSVQKINKIFHCDECKMCRKGEKKNYFHCKVCGYCRHISQQNNHKCIENVGQDHCPICMQILKYSTKPYISFPCGHLIHIHCSTDYFNINCPVCGMAIQKLSQARNRQIQKIIQQTKHNLPKQLIDKKVDILCNQCLFKSYQVPFHYWGIKCMGCGTFNTKMI